MTAWCGSCRFKTYNDNAAPLLEEQYPKVNQFNVSEDETIGLWFNEAIYNVSGANVSITPKGGQPITIQLDDASRVEVANEEGEVLVYPTHLFASRTEHTVTVPPRMLEDWSENLYAGTDFKFTTGDSYAPVIRNVSLEQTSTGGNVTAVLNLYDVVTDMAETDVLSVTGKAQATFRLVNMLTKATDVQVSSAGAEVGAGGGCPRLQNSVVLVCRGTHEAMRQPGSGWRCCLLSCREHSHHKKRMAWIFLSAHIAAGAAYIQASSPLSSRVQNWPTVPNMPCTGLRASSWTAEANR